MHLLIESEKHAARYPIQFIGNECTEFTLDAEHVLLKNKLIFISM